MSDTPGPVDRPGATPLAADDLLALADAHRQYRQERAARATFDAVDDLSAAIEAFTTAHLHHEDTSDAFQDVVQAARRFLRGAQ